MSVGTYQWNQLIVAPTYITSVPYCHIVSVYTCSFVYFMKCPDSLGRFPWTKLKRRTSALFGQNIWWKVLRFWPPKSRNGFLSKNIKKWNLFFGATKTHPSWRNKSMAKNPLPFGWSWLHIVPWESYGIGCPPQERRFSAAPGVVVVTGFEQRLTNTRGFWRKRVRKTYDG